MHYLLASHERRCDQGGMAVRTLMMNVSPGVKQRLHDRYTPRSSRNHEQGPTVLVHQVGIAAGCQVKLDPVWPPFPDVGRQIVKKRCHDKLVHSRSNGPRISCGELPTSAQSYISVKAEAPASC